MRSFRLCRSRRSDNSILKTGVFLVSFAFRLLTRTAPFLYLWTLGTSFREPAIHGQHDAFRHTDKVLWRSGGVPAMHRVDMVGTGCVYCAVGPPANELVFP